MAKKTARPQNDDPTPPQPKPRRSRARATGDAGEHNAAVVAPTPPAATAFDTATGTPRSLGDVSDTMAEAYAPRPAEVGEADEGGRTSMSSGPSEEDIRVRAYHRYLERGGEHGAHFDDWLEAERELKHRS